MFIKLYTVSLWTIFYFYHCETIQWFLKFPFSSLLSSKLCSNLYLSLYWSIYQSLSSHLMTYMTNIVYMSWFVVVVVVVQTGLNFLNQIEIFKAVYLSTIYKKGKKLIFLYFPLSCSHRVPPDLFHPPATLPLPTNPH